jgi:fatty acid desaturase
MAKAVLSIAANSGSPAFAALIWWLVPFFAVFGAIVYVTWVAKFKDKYANETNRSVTKFQSFQDSFRDDATPDS